MLSYYKAQESETLTISLDNGHIHFDPQIVAILLGDQKITHNNQTWKPACNMSQIGLECIILKYGTLVYGCLE